MSVIVRRGSQVLLVRHGGAASERVAWFLPGGVVEPGEHLHDAARREVVEETGLIVAPPERLAWVSHVVVRTGPEEVASGQAFVFEAGDPGGDPAPSDPDEDIIDAAFHDLDRAAMLIADLPYPRMREPALAYLEGRAGSGTVWLWEYGPDQPDLLVATVPHVHQATTP